MHETTYYRNEGLRYCRASANIHLPITFVSLSGSGQEVDMRASRAIQDYISATTAAGTRGKPPTESGQAEIALANCVSNNPVGSG